ncbi:TonB family protein [Methylophilus flavus]|uniref:TonB family protein n=1 Tax=Methylophilus flavus TaxID=640084 RepID=A0ABW3PAE4_9PROT
MKKPLVAIIFLLWCDISYAADEPAKEAWITDDQGCKAYNQLPQPFESIEWTGACKDGYLDGVGTLNWFHDRVQKYSYTGHFVQGKLQGKGVAEYFNNTSHGIRLEADFVDSAAHGQGVQTWPDGRRYEGEFKKGSKTGKGIKTWSNGARYEGEFKDGNPTGAGFQPLKISTRELASYPEELFLHGNAGAFFAQISVNEKANIQSIDVLFSSHPAFEKAAIRTYQNARVTPALANGKPVPERIYKVINFSLSKKSFRGALPFTYPAKASSQLPDEFQYDKPPIDKLVAPLVYPLDLLQRRVKGSAKVSVVIDPQGLPTQVELLESSAPEFGAALKAMVYSSSFYAARKNKQPSWSAFTITREFSEHDSRETAIDANGWRILNKLKDSPAKILAVSQLDTAPKPFYTPPPVYPPELADKGVTGKVLVEFYIDKEGSVQFPHTLKADNEELAWLALTAVSRWQFYPPLVKGEPVDSVMTVPVAFNLNN